MVQYRQGAIRQISETANHEIHSSILLDELGWESLENKRLNNWL